MNRKLSLFFLTLLVVLMLPTPVHGVQRGVFLVYHPPAVTFLTENAPKDLEIVIHLQRKDGSTVAVTLEKQTRAWEQQFRLYREAAFSVKSWFGNDYDLKDAELVLKSGGSQRTLKLPRELTDQMEMDDTLMLDYQSGSFKLGLPFWRYPGLLILRVLIAALLELLVFRLRSYTAARSLVTAFLAGLVLYGLLNWFTKDWLNVDIRILIPFVLVVGLVLLAQILVLVVFIDEDTKDRTMGTALLANALALGSTIAALNLLPV